MKVFRSFLKATGLPFGLWQFGNSSASRSHMTLDETISSLPQIFHENPFSERLQRLNIHRSSLGALPREICQLFNLIHLDLEDSGLTSLPAEIGRMRLLQTLNLGSNRHLQGLPSEILTLSSECRIYLSNTGLSRQTFDRLREAVSAEDYNGPIFFL